MKSIKYLLLFIVLAIGLAATNGFAQVVVVDRDREIGQESEFERRQDETDTKPVREFVQSKENIDVQQKATDLEISGDVRFEWRHLNEKGERVFVFEDEFNQEFVQLRGDGAIDNRLLPISRNDLDVEFNLKFKYTYEKAWVAAHLQFDNPAGIRGFNDCLASITVLGADESSSSVSITDLDSSVFGSFSSSEAYSPGAYSSGYSAGSPTSISSSGVNSFVVLRNGRLACKGSGEGGFINLKRAYMGYNIYADGVHRWDIEIGRRKLNDVFDSEIQYSARLDGVTLKYAAALNKQTEFFFDIAGFLIDERTNHFGYAFEFGLLDVFVNGLDLKYSFIDWTHKGKNRCFIKNALGTEFKNSQFTFSYTITREIFCQKRPIEFYGAFVINHAAKKTIFTHHMKKNLGGYLGVLVGEIDKKGDWSFDITYELVQAQMASDCDVDGIGRGNILDEHLTDIIIFPETGEFIIPRRGDANFKGWSFEFIYALTDNLSFDVQYEFTKAEDSRIGGRHKYSNVEIEAIYAF